MATDYGSLTDSEKADLAAYDKFLRALFASLAKVYKDSGADVWAVFAAGRVDPVVATLDPTAVIPNATNLANASDLTAAEFEGLQAIARGLRQQFVQNIGLLVKAVGTNV